MFAARAFFPASMTAPSAFKAGTFVLAAPMHDVASTDAFIMCAAADGGAAGVPPAFGNGGSSPCGNGGGDGGKASRPSIWSRFGRYLHTRRWCNPRIALPLPPFAALDGYRNARAGSARPLGFSLIPHPLADAMNNGTMSSHSRAALLPATHMTVTHMTGRRRILPEMDDACIEDWRKHVIVPLMSAQKALEDGKLANPPARFSDRERILSEAHGFPVRIITSFEDLLGLHRATGFYVLCYFLARLPDGSGRLYATSSEALRAFDGEQILYSGRMFVNPSLGVCNVSINEAYGPGDYELKEEYKMAVADFFHQLLGERFRR